MNKYIFTMLLSMISWSCFSQNYQDSLDLKISHFYNQKNLPGFAFAIVNMEGILYENAFGFADLEKEQAYTLETFQSIASSSKTLIALAVMQLQEAGKLSLETPINDFLPYNVYNPHFKNSIIRIKHLVTHTSGIITTDNNYELRGRYFNKLTNVEGSKLDEESLEFIRLLEKNKKMSLKKYCKNVFSAKGKWYKEDTFLKHPPGKHYAYSNLGAVLMAHIVERVSGKRFDKYVRKNILKKLNLSNSTFNAKHVDAASLATSYVGEEFISTPIFGDNTYPDGGLITNCKELSLYLIEMIKGYNGKSQLLKKASYATMMSPRLTEANTFSEETGRNFENIGVFWQLSKDGGIMHNGGNPLGGAVYMSFNPETNIGRILMTNCDIRASRDTIIEFISIWRTMDKYAGKLSFKK